MRPKRIISVIGGLAIIGVLLSVAIASGSTTRSTARVQHANTTTLGYKRASVPAAARRHSARVRANRVLIKNFRVLREARVSSTSSQAVVADALSGLVALRATRGANPAQAGETTVGVAQDPVWLVPGSTGACLVDVEGPQGAGSGCNNTNAVDDGQLWTLDTIPYGTGGAMTKVLLGVAPDGNTSVTVSWAGGGTTVVPVINNFYSVPIGTHSGWRSVTLRNSQGTIIAASGMPSLP